MAQGANGVCGGWVKQLLEAIPVVLLVAAIGLCEGRTDLGGQNKLRGRRPGWERQGSFLYIPRWRYPIHIGSGAPGGFGQGHPGESYLWCW